MIRCQPCIEHLGHFDGSAERESPRCLLAPVTGVDPDFERRFSGTPHLVQRFNGHRTSERMTLMIREVTIGK
jgi:hypothetical protein